MVFYTAFNNNSQRDGTLQSKRCLLRVMEMPVIPPKVPALTVVLGIPYCRARHRNDPWKASS